MPIGRLAAVEYWRRDAGVWKLYRHEFEDSSQGLPVLSAKRGYLEARGKFARGRDLFLEG